MVPMFLHTLIIKQVLISDGFRFSFRILMFYNIRS